MLHLEDLQLRGCTTENLVQLSQQINNELDRRRSEAREKAIKAFIDAFENLEALGVVPVYSTYEDETYLEDSDKFTFNY
jgi:hypothetical protein